MEVRSRSTIVSIPEPRIDRVSRPWLGAALFALGAGLIANSAAGPLLADVIGYPFSESMRNQAIGLEAVSLFLVAPLCVFAGVLAFRGHAAAPVIAIGPSAYAAYMFLQYVIGPEYTTYPAVLPAHLALFTLGAGIAVGAWSAIDDRSLPSMTRRTERRYAGLLLGLAAFVLLRYVPLFVEGIGEGALPDGAVRDVSMFWSIVFLDLGIVVPATLAVAAGLLAGSRWRGKGLYAVIGWFALVPPSVAAMGIAMLVYDDPSASAGEVLMLSAVALVFAAIAIRLYLPLRGKGSRS